MKLEIRSLKIFLSLTVIMDAFNGFATNYLPEVLGQIVPSIRTLALFYLLIMLLQVSKVRFTLLISILSFDIGSIFLLLNNEGQLDISHIMNELTFFSKIYFYVILLILIRSLQGINLIDSNWINEILRFNFRVMPFLFILPTIVGLSRKTYVNSSLGNSGFFIANNSSNIVLIVASIYFLVNIIKIFDSTRVVNSCYLLVTWLALWMQGSKTSVASITFELGILIVFVLTFPVIKKTVRAWQVVGYLIIVLILFIAIVVSLFNLDAIYQHLRSALQGLLIRQQYLYRASNSIIDTLLSGRFSRLQQMLSIVKSNGIPFSVVFGAGVSMLPVGFIAEMDMVDLFIDGGVFLVILVYGVTIGYMWKRNSGDRAHIFSKWGLLVLILYSLVAGHVFKEILASTFVALLVSFDRKDKKSEDSYTDPTVSKRG
ncbi:O-antigen ligase family protein [Lactobacillus sp. DCY120]|uniref:O-antigen ligase family protein n=1 Tax=Bombilactobacillus apium TaxID=2675299 RepID=A0A850QWM5_9LACO|nr:O-antigen ligase family protein [Bombilactobacillus apium]NVY96204.1 O-antigen ligase family protein [Bombilactobacillus apium]